MRSAKTFVPNRGDIIWLNFNPQSGHEQAGKRPALVLSPALYNRKTSLLICCPITSRIKGYPFEVLLPPQSKLQGVVLSDQVKSLDWRARRATLAGKSGSEVLSEVHAKLDVLLNPATM